MYKVKIAGNEQDATAAYELFYRSFGPTYYDAKEAFDFTYKYDLTLTNDNLFIIKDEKESIIAATRTLTRNLKIFDEKFDMGGIATTVVHPKYRGKGLFDAITKFILNKMIERGLCLCFVFARRSIDHIYVKHGFWGTPVERKIKILNPPHQNKNILNFRKIQVKDISFLEKTYQNVYENLPVYIDRSKQLWLTKIKHPSFNKRFHGYICTQKTTDKPIGYAIAEHGKGIVDVCSSGESPEIYESILFSKNSPVREAASTNISLPTEHPAVKAFRGCSYSIYTRHPHYGGNVLKILDPYNRETKIMKLVDSKLAARDVKISKDFINLPPHIVSRVITAALFGYEIPETRTVLEISKESRWNTLKPVDFIFSSLDDF